MLYFVFYIWPKAIGESGLQHISTGFMRSRCGSDIIRNKSKQRRNGPESRSGVQSKSEIAG